MSVDQVYPEGGLLAELSTIVGSRGLLTGGDALSRSCDPFRDMPPESGIIVRPSNTAELAAVMACCHKRGQRIVTHGGRTGLAGGACANADEIVLSLERMSEIEEIDVVGQTMRVQAGATLESAHNAALEENLCYPVDLGAKGTATIGGTIATNAGGNRVLRWGMTRQNVLGVEAVLSDGRIVSSLNRHIKNNTGYDLKHLFIGTEGTLGIVTRATLRLIPAPVSQSVAFVSTPDFESLLGLLGKARRLPSLSAFEVMWRDYYEMMVASESNRSPLECNQGYYALIEAMGYSEEVDTDLFNAFLEAAYEEGLIADAVVATSDRQIADLWHVREGSEIIAHEMNPFVSFDISVDIRSAEQFINEVRASLTDRYPNARSVTFGHLGDGNLHIAVHVGPETMDHELQIERCVYDVVKKYGGALTAEHGIGQFKRDFLPEHRTPEEMEVMRTVRQALDADLLLNRNVLF